MTTLGVRLAKATIDIINASPFDLGIDLFCGFAYAKLSSLPADQVVKAWVVWGEAEMALGCFAVAVTENELAQKWISATIRAVTGAIGITEMQKRGLIGHKMIICIVAFRSLDMFNALVSTLLSFSSVKNVLEEKKALNSQNI